MRLSLGSHLEGAVEARLAGLEADRLPGRLMERDPSLWSADPERHPAIRGRLGWLAAPEAMAAEIAGWRALAGEVAAEGFSRAVLLGMGGSSLAPEVLRAVLGVGAGALDLIVLDDTSPDAVAALDERIDPARTLFVVASKSGATIEVVSFERYCYERARAARGDGAGRAFVAITDPGTRLERLAQTRGYRRVVHGWPDIGGRYSAISPFGLVPAALTGADLDHLVAGARGEIATLGSATAREVPGVLLGAVMGEAALGGRDKLTLVADPALASFGAWVEQLVAESTGKEGRGILPVVEEEPGPPDLYGRDRLFVALGSFAGSPATAAALAALEATGHPVVAWDPFERGLGAEFVRWEIATATAAAILRVDPFDEPNVAEAKHATQSVLEGYLVAKRFPEATPLATAGGLTAQAPAATAERCRPHVADPARPAAWLPALLALASPGEYVALLAYLHRTPARHRALQRLRERLRAGRRLATTLGYGPRYLHSTGQLHKGGPDTGSFLLLTADPLAERGIPEERFGFGVLQRAQAAGDYAALERRGRRLLRIHLGRDVEAGLETLIAAVEAAAPL